MDYRDMDYKNIERHKLYSIILRAEWKVTEEKIVKVEPDKIEKMLLETRKRRSKQNDR